MKTKDLPLDRQVHALRFEARLAYLDGRTKRARELNTKADKLAEQLRKVAA